MLRYVARRIRVVRALRNKCVSELRVQHLFLKDRGIEAGTTFASVVGPIAEVPRCTHEGDLRIGHLRPQTPCIHMERQHVIGVHLESVGVVLARRSDPSIQHHWRHDRLGTFPRCQDLRFIAYRKSEGAQIS